MSPDFLPPDLQFSEMTYMNCVSKSQSDYYRGKCPILSYKGTFSLGWTARLLIEMDTQGLDFEGQLLYSSSVRLAIASGTRDVPSPFAYL